MTEDPEPSAPSVPEGRRPVKRGALPTPAEEIEDAPVFEPDPAKRSPQEPAEGGG